MMQRANNKLSTEEMIDLLRQHLPYLAAEFGVKRLGVFGSCARGEAGAESDVDIIVEFERPIGLKFIELAEYLEHLLGRKVDLLTTAGLRGIRIPWIAEEIERSILYVQERG